MAMIPLAIPHNVLKPQALACAYNSLKIAQTEVCGYLSATYPRQAG
jgi:hypothetical protein